MNRRADPAAGIVSSSYTKSYYFINFKNMFYIKTGNIKKAHLINEHSISQMISFHINLQFISLNWRIRKTIVSHSTFIHGYKSFENYFIRIPKSNTNLCHLIHAPSDKFSIFKGNIEFFSLPNGTFLETCLNVSSSQPTSLVHVNKILFNFTLN